MSKEEAMSGDSTIANQPITARLKSVLRWPSFWILLIAIIASTFWFDEFWESQLPDDKYAPPTSLILGIAAISCTDLRTKFDRLLAVFGPIFFAIIAVFTIAMLNQKTINPAFVRLSGLLVLLSAFPAVSCLTMNVVFKWLGKPEWMFGNVGEYS